MYINFNLLMENESILNKPKQVSFYLAHSFSEPYPCHDPQICISSEMKKLCVYLFFVNIDVIITVHMHLYFWPHNLNKEMRKKTSRNVYLYFTMCVCVGGETPFKKVISGITK